MPSQPVSRVEQFVVTIPPNTAKVPGLEVPTVWQSGELLGIRIRIPEGHSFLTGMQLLVAHARALPTTEGSWIVGDDDVVELDLLGQVNTGAWSVLGYNLDIYPHTFYVTYYILDTAYQYPASDATPIATPFIA